MTANEFYCGSATRSPAMKTIRVTEKDDALYQAIRKAVESVWNNQPSEEIDKASLLATAAAMQWLLRGSGEACESTPPGNTFAKIVNTGNSRAK